MQRAAAVLLCLCAATAVQGRRQLLQSAPPPPPNGGASPAPTNNGSSGGGGGAPGEKHFVRVEGLDFLNGCNKFYVAGWNQWEVVEAAAGAPFLSGASIPVGMTGPELVRTLMDEAVAAGLNTMRTWAHAVNPQYALQKAPGQYNEAVFRGLDYVLDEARKRGLKVILAFTSNWTPVGGIPEYLKWAGASQPVQFYTDPSIKQTYKNFVAAVTGRVNTINGRRYSEDPTILAWNLINEPRCAGCPAGTIANWVGEMAGYVKQVDPNHLVTVGEDGFYACCKNPANPGVQYSEWAAQEGQDFIADHSSPNIDFASFHGWVDNWQAVSQDFLRTWVTQHTNDATNVLKKPVVFDEFGKWVNTSAGASLEDRNTFFQFAYQLVSDLQRQNTALKGAMFWQMYAQGQEAPASEGGGRGLYGVYASDPAFQYVKDNAAMAKQLSTPVPSCTPAAHKAAPAAPDDCKRTWVNGQAGTGLEGPSCSIEINECVRGTATCAANAACVNTNGGYNCICHWGYDGDGKTCNPNEKAIQELQSVYWSQQTGLACDPGEDVEWPSDGPGFVYDPTGSFDFFNSTGGGKFGSRTNVTLVECMEACQMQEECESFVYNDVLAQCFLKRGQCPTANFCWNPKPMVCYSDNDRGGSFAFDCGFWRSYYRLDMDTQAACANYQYVPVDWGKPDPANLQPFQAFMSRLAQASNRYNPATEPKQTREAAGEAAPAQPGAGLPAAVPAAKPAATGNPGNGSVPLLSDFLGGQPGQPTVQLVTASEGPGQGK